MIGFQSSILAGVTLVRAAIRSPNYVPGVSGWTINQDGSSEFNDVTVRGELFVTDPSGSYVRIFNNGGVPQINMQGPLYTDPGPAGAGQSGAQIFADTQQLGASSFGRLRLISPEFTAPGFSNAQIFLSGESFDSAFPSSATISADEITLSGPTDVAGALAVTGALTTTGLINGGYTYVDTQIFTAGGNFTKATYPTGKLARIRLCGGGGGGGGADATGAAQWSYGDGGGGGESGFVDVLFSSMAAAEVVTVGGGGAGGAATGTSGTASSFGAFITTNGGGGGSFRQAATSVVGNYSQNSTARGGGSGGAGGTRWRGTSGGSGNGYGTATASVRGGDGGASAFSGAIPAPGPNAAGTAGASFGGGGSGAANSVSQAARNGGNGTAGIVIVEIYG